MINLWTRKSHVKLRHFAGVYEVADNSFLLKPVKQHLNILTTL